MTERRLLSAPENVDLSLIPLTEYGLRHGLLTEDDLRRLRAESLPLLRCQAERPLAGAAAPFPLKRLKRCSIPCSTPFHWRSNAALRPKKR